MALNPFRVYRISNRLKDIDARHLKLVHEAIAKSRDLLKNALPDTFAGRKTQEPFPKKDDILD
jgi:hypothetical protein